MITGGARSGKSRYGEQRTRQLGNRLAYVATAEAKDQEMAQRIATHRKSRGDDWITVEEPLEVRAALAALRGKADCALVDCVTLWISNLVLSQGTNEARQNVEDLIRSFPGLNFHLIFVTNEVGWGIVPDNELAREFRDLAGWTNQRLAEVAHEVILMVSGIPVIVKGTSCA